MAALTIIGLSATFLAALAAKDAATASRDTANKIAKADLLASMNAIRSLIDDLDASTDRGSSEVVQHALLKLAAQLDLTAALGEQAGEELFSDGSLSQMLREISVKSSQTKAKIARIPNPKLSNHTGTLIVELRDLAQQFTTIEVTLRYSIESEKGR